MPKISDLTALTGPNVAAADLFVADDVSATTTKSVRGDALLQAAIQAAAGSLLDANGNELLKLGTTAAAVNEVTVTNKDTGNAPTIAATGNDTNVGLKIDAKGSGTLDLNLTATGNVKVGTNLQTASAKSIVDANGNELIEFPATIAAAINQLKISPSAAAGPVIVATNGGDTDIDLSIAPKGAGKVALANTTLKFPSAGIVADTNGNELLKFPATVASAVNEVTLSNAATGAGPLVAATGNDTNIPISIDGKGSGLIKLSTTGTGNVQVGTNVQLVSAGSIVDANGNEIIKSAATVASAVNEVTVTNAATGSGPQIGSTGNDTNIDLKILPKGTGVVKVDGGVVSIDPSDGVGYATGAGGTVGQLTSRSTGVTLSKVTGAITTDTTSLAAGASATFTVTNTTVAATDVVVLSIKSGQTNKESGVLVSRVAAGAFDITVHNQHASVAEVGAIVINFAVIKGVAA